MKKYRNLLLRLIPLFLVILLTFGLSYVFYQNMIDSTIAKCWDELSMAHSEASREISTHLDANVKMLNYAADAIMTNVDLEDDAALAAYLSAVKGQTIFDRIDVIFPDGTALMQSGERAEAHSPAAYQALTAMGSHLSQRQTEQQTGLACIHAFAPIFDAAGQSLAILDATLYCRTMAELFISAHYETDSQLFLLDLRDGHFVLDKWRPELGNIYEMERLKVTRDYASEDYVRAVMAGESGQVAFESAINGKLSYLYYAPMEDTPFSLGMVLQEDVVFAEVHELRNTLLRVGTVETALLFFFIAWTYAIMRNSLDNENRARQAELALLHQKESELKSQYAAAAERQKFLEAMAVNLPGGYHRVTTDHRFRVSFMSNSFTQVTGYTAAQMHEELDDSYMGIVAPEDQAYFLSLAPLLEREGSIQCAYRIRRRDGSIRWVKDITQYVAREGAAYYQCALMDITEQIEEIEYAKRQAEASSQAKSTFLFNISHDIRTPMNAVKGFSHIIEENADNPELVLSTIGKIKQASESLMMLMNDVLDISRIEKGKEELNLQPVQLREHGRNLYEMFAAEMEEAGIRFIAEEGDGLLDQVYCDELKLTRIIMNMLSNAKKFTPAGGTVTYGSARLAKDEKTCTYRFYVRDTGIGMSPEFRKRAFQQFERERTSTESGVAGSGLGLAIIKMLVELMGGTAEIQSELGRGTEISATIPFRLAAEEPREKSQPLQASAADMSGKRVLLVEDNEFNREIARYMLEGLHIAVDDAENGAVCIKKLRSAGPGWYDLILMDIQMPVMDGYTAAMEIRSLEDGALSAIPIVAMTANAFSEDKQKCLDAGMNGHIGKPIDMEVLMKVLTQVL